MRDGFGCPVFFGSQYNGFMRGVIDIGSNSVLLLIAERGEDGRLEIACDRATVARLSQGAAARGSLSPEAIERTLAVLREYRSVADEHGVELTAVATEGVRMAANQDDFLEPAAAILGAPVRLISGEEEARLSYRSVALEAADDQPLRVVDIGGASTELVVGRGIDIDSAVSHRVGSVRFTEQFADRLPPSADAIERIYAAAREALGAQPVAPAPQLCGLAGTVTTLGSLLLGLERYDRDRVDGSTHAVDAIRDARDELGSQSLGSLQVIPVLGKGRADVIVTGVTILLAVLDHCGARELLIRDRGLRYALL